jgi:NADPH-dependent 2,4-dienoyl-CoA reductase/sulfur reductase-like enzyme
VKSGGPISCIVNPEVGHEREPLGQAPKPKHIVVVGGGPAGLQTAITARQRGHRVTLLDKGTLGGQFAFSSLAPGKAPMEKTHSALARRAKLEGVELKTEVTADTLAVVALAPDEVVVATGSEAVRIPVPGLEPAHSGVDVLEGRFEPGKRTLVVGGGLVGIEVAEHLAERGVSVVVVEMLEDIARDMEMVTRKLTMRRLATLPVTIHKNARITRVDKGEAFVQRKETTSEESLGTFDSFVVAVGNHSVDPMSAVLRERGLTVHVIGDASKPGQVWDATQAGYQLARTL